MAAQALTRREMRRLSYLLELAPLSPFSRLQAPLPRLSCFSTPRTRCAHSRAPVSPKKTPASTKVQASARQAVLPSQRAPAADRVLSVVDDSLAILGPDIVPSEQDVLGSLSMLQNLVRDLERTKEARASASQEQDSPATDLLFLSEDSAQGKADVEGIWRISAAADKIATHQNVFLTAAILQKYVEIQSALGSPAAFARVFQQYAHKPAPVPGSSPVQYKRAAPDRAASAVPLASAHLALEAAIASRDLSLCLDIIDGSVCTAAFGRAKLVRQAMVPAAGLALAPGAAYALASQFAAAQETMAAESARLVAFAGIAAYVACTATLGVVAVATPNHHQRRGSWAGGMPLRARWMREPERAMLDRVAQAWGFADGERRGEEEGPEWEALRDLIGLRGMVLDKVELMEGMQ